ncbi:carbohydrate ABC transporter permease [Roseibium aggregatum]|uniref:Maltose/maltodextrin transport system permease protein MalG n=1 Tax=Roseibium aggregatum TaxID=187304 RepID=A0A939EG50_9HYPH|nr:carbohydrate ABC transporter permease [Roseibium aggregatum]MBN9671857.1 carbohydrate ABC transporter permease [Roseibium aggregatum]
MSGEERMARPVDQPDWESLARRALTMARIKRGALIVFLTLVSVPVLLPFFWVVVISFSARTGGVETAVLWKACGVLAPCVLGYAATHVVFPAPRQRMTAALVAAGVAVAGLALLVGSDLHFDNYRFLANPNLVEDLRGAATAGGQFPWVWDAFFNSLAVAAASTFTKVLIATLAGYYLSRFAFRGRSFFLQSLLILEVFHPWMLTIPIFLVIFWVGLLNTLSAPILVLTVIDMPFFIFIMKGFFDAVPWDIEMSAMTDGATRRQAFWHVVLPQAKGGIIAISVLGFIRGWEEYVFVTALRTGNSYWVMSTYLYYVAEDVMGVDYGLVAAVSVFYMLPSLLLYLFLQKYLTQLTFGGVKG